MAREVRNGRLGAWQAGKSGHRQHSRACRLAMALLAACLLAVGVVPTRAGALPSISFPDIRIPGFDELFGGETFDPASAELFVGIDGYPRDLAYADGYLIVLTDSERLYRVNIETREVSPIGVGGYRLRSNAGKVYLDVRDSSDTGGSEWLYELNPFTGALRHVWRGDWGFSSRFFHANPYGDYVYWIEVSRNGTTLWKTRLDGSGDWIAVAGYPPDDPRIVDISGPNLAIAPQEDPICGSGSFYPDRFTDGGELMIGVCRERPGGFDFRRLVGTPGGGVLIDPADVRFGLDPQAAARVGCSLFVADLYRGIIRFGCTFLSRLVWTLFGPRRSGGYASDPVNVATGNFVQEETDLSFPGSAPGLDFTRTYNAEDPRSGSLGRGWSTNLGAHLGALPSGGVAFVDVDGRVVNFEPNGTGGFTRPEEVFADLIAHPDGTYALRYDNGHTLGFDTSGRLVSGANPDGTTTTYAHDVQGRLTSATHSAGQSIAFSYDATGWLTSASASDGRVVTYAYNAAGYLSTVTDPTGGVTRYDTDGEGRITKITDPDGVVEVENTYDIYDRIVTQSGPGGWSASFAYDPDRRRTLVRYMPSGAIVTYNYDEQGRVTQATDPYGKSLSKTYDPSGNLTAVTDRRGTGTTQTFDAHGNVLTRAGPTGTERFTYDSSDRLTSVTDTAGAITTYAYEGNERTPSSVTDATGALTTNVVDDGLVTRTTDADGVTQSFAYDARRRLTSSTDGVGGVTRYVTDAMGNPTSVKTPLGNTTTNIYNQAGRLTSTTDATGARTSYTYTPAGRLAATTDATGAVTTRAYDSAGRIESTTDPAGGVTTYTHDADSNLTKTTGPSGEVTTSTYDALGRNLSSTDPAGATSRTAFDDDGNPITQTDPVGAATTSVYDAAGRVVTTRDGLGRATHYAYDAAGRLATLTAPSGVTTYAYDAAGRRVAVTDPTGAVTRSRYTRAGRLNASIDATGATTTYAYDAAGRLVSTTDATGAVTRSAYDADSRVTQTTSPTGLVTRYGYDALGRRVFVTDPTGGRWRTTYSPRGEVTAEADPAGATKRFSYDPAGRMENATDANGARTAFAYDASGRLTSTTDPRGAVTTRSYDQAGRLAATTDALMRTTTYAYDPTGRLASIADPSGHTQSLAYDAAGQLTSRTYGDGTSVAFTYDQAGRRTEMTDATGVTRYVHDQAGRLTQTTSPDGKTLRYSYDQAGRRASLTYPDGTVVSYSYDPGGRLTKLTSPGGDVTYNYDADGRLVSESLPQGVSRTYTYTAGRLTRYAQTSAGDDDDDDNEVTTLVYDAAGRRTSQNSDGKTTTYAYDAAGQLTGVAGGDNGRGNDVAFSYDALGNRASMTKGNTKTTYSYDEASQLTAATQRNRSTTYEYDAAGRRIEERSGQRSVATSYDAAGRASSITTTEGEGTPRTETRTHNGNGILVGVAFTGDGDHEDTDDDGDAASGATALLWDTTLSVPQIAVMTTGGVDTNLVYGAGRALAITGTKTTVFSHDVFGSAIRGDEDDDDGTDLVRAQRYDAFGVPGDSSNNEGLSFGYRGELHIDGLIHLRNRDYDPTTGAFTTRDPIAGAPGAPATATPYPYAANDPINKTDPMGLRPSDGSFRRGPGGTGPAGPMGPTGGPTGPAGPMGPTGGPTGPPPPSSPDPTPDVCGVSTAPVFLASGLSYGDAANAQLAQFQIPVDYCKGVVRINFYISADHVDAPGFGTFAGDGRGPIAQSTAWDSRASFELDFTRGLGRLFVNYTCGYRSGLLRDRDYTCHDALPIGIGPVNTTTPVTNSGFNELDVRRRDSEDELELRWKLPNPLTRVMGVTPCAITGQVTFDLGEDGSGIRLEDKVFRDFPSMEIYQFAGGRTITHENRHEGNPLELCAPR